MTIDELKYFKSVAEAKSFSVAAENLFVTQSTISNAINRLENELGVTLFVREKSGTYLTDIGQKVLGSVTKLLEEVNTIKQNTMIYNQLMPETLTGELSIEVVPNSFLLIFRDTLEQFQKYFPMVKVTIIENNAQNIINNLTNSPYDISIFSLLKNGDNIDDDILAELEQQSELYGIEKMGSYRLYVAMSEHHPLANRKQLTLEDLESYPLGNLVYPSGSEACIDRILATASDEHDFSVVFETNSTQLLAEYILKGKCICIISSLNIFPPDAKFVPLKNSLSLELYYCYKKNSKNRDTIDAFLSIYNSIA